MNYSITALRIMAL